MKFSYKGPLKGEITVPGDKSISHRAIMLGAIAKGDTVVTGFLKSADCISTMNCFRQMGIEISEEPDRIIVHGKGMRGLSAPVKPLDAGNSGTTTRLMSGILSAQYFSSTIVGDESLSKRPMKRITTPLSRMGASFSDEHLPMTITGGKLSSITYDSPVASAQVKSAIAFAGLYADGITKVTEPVLSRNHTELMLESFGATVRSTLGERAEAEIEPANELFACDICVPGDISSAAYFIAAASLIPDSDILIKNVGINPTRDGMIKVAKNMGADIELLNERKAGSEIVCDIHVKYAKLKGTAIEGRIIPTLIDEIPVLAVMAALSEGTTVIKDAGELKVKETDRIKTVCDGLSALGVKCTETEDGMIIYGQESISGGVVESAFDHRIAMAFCTLAHTCKSEIQINNAQCVNISYPEFYADMEKLIKKL